MTEPYAAIAETIARDGFAFVRAPEMPRLMETPGAGVGAGGGPGRGPPRVGRDPADEPVPVRSNDAGRGPARSMACRAASVSHRGAARPRGPPDPRRHAPRRRRLGPSADGAPREYRERRDHDLRS